MTNQETYDRTLDAPTLPPPASVPPAPATLPNEPYYQQHSAPRRAARNASLGIALVLVGLALLAFQLFGRGVQLGGTIALVDRQLPGNRIELSAGSSDVEVQSWDGSLIRVEATQRGGSSGDYTIAVDTSGDTVRVVESSNNLFCFFCSREVNYRISVPAGAQAKIETTSGEIQVEGLSGPVTLATVSGDIRASDLSGGLAAGTTSGEVQLNNLAGRLEVKTISGDVQLEDGKVAGATVNTTSGEIELAGVSGSLEVGTVSGDVTVRAARDAAAQLALSTTSGSIQYAGGLAPGAHTVSSISGDITLELPENSDLALDASTVGGDISNDFELSAREEGLRSLKGTTGSGVATLKLETTSGNIAIQKR